MSVSKEQAQMLAALAVACRPYRAPTWDHAGVVANIAKVKDRSLSEVILAVIRAAADRECQSPGVIPSAGTHWQEQLKPEKWQPDSTDPHLRCSTCDEREPICRTRWAGDHDYEPRHVKHQLDVTRTVAAIKETLMSAPRTTESETQQ